MAKPVLPPRQRLEYILEDKEYTVGELAATLEESIPFTVLVTKGYTNPHLPYTGLEENTAYRVNCVSRSKRVLAVIDPKRDGRPKTIYSISDVYYISMIRVDENGREIGTRQSLYQLLSENKLPLRVKFSTDKFAKLDGKVLFTNHIPPLLLFHTFEEVHILVNKVENISNYDKMDDDILYIPQFYNKIRMKRIRGIQGVLPEKFLKMEVALTSASGALEFDLQYNQMEIEEYAPHFFRKDIVYTDMEPLRSGKIPDLFPKMVPDLPTYEYESASQVSSDDHPYDIIRDHLLKRGGAGDVKTPRDYTNNIPRGMVKPIKSSQTHIGNLVSELKLRVGKESNEPKVKRSQSEPMDNRLLPAVNKAEDIKSLSIDDVAGYLEKLRLGTHKKMFKDHMIDGVVLSDLTQDILTKDFGFKAIDAIKLMHFIKEGHVPR